MLNPSSVANQRDPRFSPLTLAIALALALAIIERSSSLALQHSTHHHYRRKTLPSRVLSNWSCLTVPNAVPCPDQEKHYHETYTPCYALPFTPSGIPRQEVRLDREHLGRDAGREAVHLPRVLLHLPRVEQRLQPAGLLRQLEQPLPLVLGQQRLLRRRPRRVLRLALRLPCRDLGLLTRERALVVLVVVELRVVVLDALEEQVACLLEERVDGEVERVVVGVQRGLRRVLVLEQRRQVRGEGELLLGCLCGQLVEEGGEEVRVADGDGELDKDVRVPEAALLEAASR